MQTTKGSSFIGVLGTLLLFFFPFHNIFAQCINTFPAVEDFETGPVWTAFTAPTSSVAATSDWAWGTPNHTYVIKSAGSGNKCWSTGGLTGAFYNYNQESYILSPCYNFTTLLYPHIKFKLFYDSEYKYDGANLQSSIDGGATWQDVGTCGGTNAAPVPEPNDCNTHNWYNYPGVTYLNKPAGFVTSQNGWCGNVEAGGVGWDATHPAVNCVGGNGIGHWVTAEHCLTGLAGQPNVLLRFTFGAGYSCNDFDGFAIDSVAVSNGVSNSATYTHVCASANTVNFSATPNACPTNTYAWNFGDPGSGASNTSASQNPSHTFSGPGSYTVSLIASGGACNPPDTIKQVINIMTASVTSFTNVSCNGGNNGAAVVTVTSGIPAITYTWSPTGGNSANASGLTAGNYTVSVSDGGSCPVTATVTITEPTPLSATVTSTNGTGCANAGTATVTVSGGTPAYTYTWSPTGGNNSTASGLSSGNYTVSVLDANSCATTATTNIISPPPSFSLTLNSTNVSCFGGSDGTATVTTTGGSGTFTYQWQPTGGNNSTASNLNSGTYTVQVTDVTAGCQTTATVNITQPSSVTVTATGQTICNGQTVTINASASGGNGAPYSYLWNTGSTVTSITVTPITNTTYTVVATDPKGCTAFDTAIIHVLPPLNIVVTSNDSICEGQQATLSAVASGGNGNYSIVWMPGNLTGNSIVVTPTVTTTYTATVTDGCTILPASATGQVVVTPIPILSFNPNPSSGCQPVCVTFAGISTNIPNNNVISYNWNFGDGQGASGINASHCYYASGNYNVTLYGVTQKGCKDSMRVNNAIHVFPNPHADFTADPFVTDIYENTIHFYDMSSGSVATWNWVLLPGVNSPFQNPVYTFAPEGTYPVTLIVSNANGCKDSITKEIIIKPLFTFYAPNAFTPNSDGLNEIFLPTGTAWDLNTYNLWVFDRWGMQLYHSTDASKGWDGTKHGDVLQEDVYVWKVELNDTFGMSHEYNGHVSIVK